MTLTDQLAELARKAGADSYWDLDDNGQAAVAFGMCPLEVVKSFSDRMRRTIADKMAANYCSDPAGEPEVAEAYYKSMKKDFLAEIEKAFCLGLFSSAKQAGRMIA